ncbi:MAG: hypothetical protein C4581_10440 [Nitrospiraceae bacterium]|nr:MAG: hypothetical protein C4581_10440 [Nitrospiraceae bacterium]
MSVSRITESPGPQPLTDSQQKTAPTGFSKVLDDTVPGMDKSKAGNADKAPLIEIGRISKETPTVSHMLINHPEYANKCWDVVYSSENRSKQFTKMREGTIVTLKPGSNELLWESEHSAPDNKVISGASAPAQGTIRDKAIVIGTIIRDHPTVSHLFEAHPDFDRRFWDIINAPVNSSKDYKALRPGTRIELNPATMELSFINNSPETTIIQSANHTRHVPDAGSEDNNYVSLADAVKPYMGTPYNQIDCYGLVVRGLMNQGIQYNGHGGLRERLENQAARDGRPGNAYFSGEGLVEQAGIKVYSKSIKNISNPDSTADEIYSELMPLLREGMILSFSTPTRGHTGVVSQQDSEWTYINSGVIDHDISRGTVSKRVGEEVLKAEVNNWCVLAAGRREPLMVTIGQIDRNKLLGSVRLKEII